MQAWMLATSGGNASVVFIVLVNLLHLFSELASCG